MINQGGGLIMRKPRINILFIVVLLAVLAAAEVVVYKPKFRLGSELLPAVRAAMGAQGNVALDERTGALVISGDAEAVARARSVLEQLDKKPRTVVVTVRQTDVSALTNLGLDIRWSVVGGGWRLGTVRDDQTLDGERWEVRAGKSVRVYRSNAASDQTIRVLEGSSATLLSGRKREFDQDSVFWSQFTGPGLRGREREVLTQLHVTPRIVGDAVQLDIEPQATFFAGTQRETRTVAEARTTVRVPIGGSILLAASSTQGSSASWEIFQGFAVDATPQDTARRCLWLQVMVED